MGSFRLRKFPLQLCVAGIAAVAACVYGCGRSGAPQSDAEWRQDLEKWRAQHSVELQQPDGWLTLVALHFMGVGDNTFGADKSNRVRVPSGPAHVGALRLVKMQHFGTPGHEEWIVKGPTLLPPPGGFPKDFLVDGKPPVPGMDIRSDGGGPPSRMTTGSLLFTVIRRSDQYALRVKDSDAEARKNFHGEKWLDPNQAYVIQAHWTPYTPAKRMSVPTVINTKYDALCPGVAEFTVDGKTLRLEPVLEENQPNQLFFILKDTTSETNTYEAGRFLYTALPSHGLDQAGEIWLDFNRLENPPCAYSPYATCPLPPPQNKLSVALPVGELRYNSK